MNHLSLSAKGKAPLFLCIMLPFIVALLPNQSLAQVRRQTKPPSPVPIQKPPIGPRRPDPVIDDAQRFAYDVSITAPQGTLDLTSAVIPAITLRNKTNEELLLAVRVVVERGYMGYDNSHQVLLGSGESRTEESEACLIFGSGVYSIRCDVHPVSPPTAVTQDSTIVGTFTVQRHDVLPHSIVAPIDSVNLGQTVTPRVFVHNNYGAPVSCPVQLSISDGYSDARTVSVAGFATEPVEFKSWAASSVGPQTAHCAVSLANDMDRANDTLTAAFSVRGAGQPAGGQTQPPPTGGRTVIPRTPLLGQQDTVIVKLAWGTKRTDFDLYLFGAGDTVCWGHMRKLSGPALDKDDRDGYGPEKIVVPVGGKPAYRAASVGVHYYGPPRGDASKAQVTFYRGQKVVTQTGWRRLRPGDLWRVGSVSLSSGAVTLLPDGGKVTHLSPSALPRKP